MDRKIDSKIIEQKLEEAMTNLEKSNNVLAFKEKDGNLESLAKHTESSDTAVVDISVNKEIERKFVERFKVDKFPVLISYGVKIFNDEHLEKNLKQREENEKKYFEKFIDNLVKSEKMFIFIKGSPQYPKCKFTRRLIEIFTEKELFCGVHYNYFDILSDPKLRQQLKELNNWPTYPQIYINGVFVGGLDILETLIEKQIFERLYNDS